MQSHVLKLFGFLLVFLFSQVGHVAGSGYKAKFNAADHIVDLRDGTMVVRLMTKQTLVDAFLMRGDTISANIIIKQQRVANLRQMKAFKDEYTFGKILFFFSHDSQIILDKDFETPVFLNDELEKDANLIPTGKMYMCEIGTTDKLDLSAISISDSSFTQLSHPFPFMVRKFTDTIIERSDRKVISKLVNKLNNFYFVKYPNITGIKPEKTESYSKENSDR